MLWIKFAFVYLDFVDEAAIMEQRGRFGSIRMVWTRNTDVSPGKNDVTSLVVDIPQVHDELSSVFSLS